MITALTKCFKRAKTLILLNFIYHLVFFVFVNSGKRGKAYADKSDKARGGELRKC